MTEAELPVTSRKGFMVKAMEAIEEWAEDNDLGASIHDEYELAERMWALWESAGQASEGPSMVAVGEGQPEDGQLCICRIQYDYPAVVLETGKQIVRYQLLTWDGQEGLFRTRQIYASHITHWLKCPTLEGEQRGPAA